MNSSATTKPALQFTNALQTTGIERLTLIGRHSAPLMHAYVQGELDESAVSERALRKLVEANVIYQPDEARGFVLRPQLSDLIASMVADENRRHVNADVGDKLETIRLRVRTFREAQRRGDTVKTAQQLHLLTSEVHDLAGQFGEAIDSLWHRLNSNFGFVSSLTDKIRENDRAQKQIARLLDGLNLVDFDELIALGEGTVQLRKLLVSQLQRQLSAHHSSLLEVQRRLVQLMVRFREQQARSLLIANMAAYLREHISFSVGDYAYRSHVPALINQAPALIPAAAIALDQHASRQQVAELMSELEVTRQPTHQPPASRGEITLPAGQTMVEARQQQLKTDVEHFMLAVIDASSALSALNYWHQKKLGWDPEVWLFQVLGELQSLPRDQQQLFAVQRHERPMHAYNQVLVISDIDIALKRAA